MDHRKQSRREFVRFAVAAAFPLFFPPHAVAPKFPRESQSTDDEICRSCLRRGQKESLHLMPLGDLVTVMGKTFIGRPYAPGTLEQSGPERLVVNLREFDCVTFCETSLGLARSIKMHETSVEGYRRQLQLLRYRDGVISGYASRLHYFCDWIGDNARRGVVEDVTKDLGGVPDEKTIDFMSKHRAYYPRLSDQTIFGQIVAMEKQLSSRKRFILPKERVEKVLDQIGNGDIIGIASSEEGLDISHTGIAVKEGKLTKLLHAPNVGKSVQISHGLLTEYLASHQAQTGIMVARPRDPALPPG